jgi:CDP-glucose 4,6-dehydratase
VGQRQRAVEGLVMNSFWAGKRVLVTGHTGFKGSWLAQWLLRMGADVYGYALEPDTSPSLFAQLGLGSRINQRLHDISELDDIMAYVGDLKPEFVFHFAAQSLVLRGYAQTPVTWATNVMGTVNVLEALRKTPYSCTAIMVTTDKVYQNREWVHAYRETDRLGGLDPYSASKAGSELVVASYRAVFKQEKCPIRVASARAGNVIGGGDWAENRLVPDIARALMDGRPITLRNPASIRPWQHVLEPLAGYLLLAEKLAADEAFADAYNFGPVPEDCRTVEEVVQAALIAWPGEYAVEVNENAPKEAEILKLSIDKASAELGWHPKWDFHEAVEWTIDWYRSVHEGRRAVDITLDQIEAFEQS